MDACDDDQGCTEARVRDEALALAAAGDDAELAAELYQALRSNLPRELTQLRELSAAADWEGIAEVAHRLRGATRYCGVPALDRALTNLEPLARTGTDANGISAALERVEIEAQRLP